MANPGFPGPVTVMDTVAHLGELASDGDAGDITRVLRNMTCQTWKDDETVDLRSLEEGLAAWN